MSKIAYAYDEKTGEYNGHVQAQESPLEQGVYLLPAGALFDAPPAVAKNQVACVVKGLWVIKADFRGIWYKPNHDIIEITEIDVYPDATWSITNPPKTLAELKLDKIIEITASFEKAINAVKNGYPQDEIASWPKQETEARAYQASALAVTPLIDALATARGIVKTDLVTRIIAKSDLFANISGQLIGKRQKLEDALNALPLTATKADVDLIVW